MRGFWAADCETDPFKKGRFPQPFLFGATNGDEYVTFNTAAEFAEFFYRKPVIVYAHNGGKFDWHFLLDELEANTSEGIVAGVKTRFTPLTIINGRFAKFKIGEAEYRDSFSIIPVAQGEFGEKHEITDWSIFEKENRDKPKNRIEIEKRLRTDCFGLWAILKSFFDKYGRHLTIASAAVKTWESISDEKADRSNAGFYEYLSPYYFGGRVQCFRKGYRKEKFQVVDINSAYPFAMLRDHPWGLSYFTDNRLPQDRAKIERSFISIDTYGTGSFPFRNGNTLEFPADGERRVFHVTGWEYLAAKETGTLDARHRIVKVIQFDDRINFKKFVNHFYELKAAAKKSGDRAGYIFSKLMLVSCYGKFGAAPHRYKEFRAIEPDQFDIYQADGWETVTHLYRCGIVQRDLPEHSQRFFNVAVAASITGFVRAYLWRAIVKSKGVLYCDTDSIAAVRPNVDIGPDLGQWEKEGDFSTWAIGGKKLYAFRYKKPQGKKTHKIASKGVKLTAKEIEAIAQGSEITYDPEVPTFGIKGKRFTPRKVKLTE